jgi:hypothetical protein
VIWDGAGFHQRDGDADVPSNVRLLQLSPYSPELNPAEGVGSDVKGAVCDRLYNTLLDLEEAIIAGLRPLMPPCAAASTLGCAFKQTLPFRPKVGNQLIRTEEGLGEFFITREHPFVEFDAAKKFSTQ